MNRSFDIRPATAGPDFDQALVAILRDHARSVGHDFTRQDWGYAAHDANTFLGGISARVGTHWVFVEHLAVLPAARGARLGRALMDRVETRARAESKAGIWLDTFSFQAADFYLHLGYAETGRIRDYLPGADRIWLARRF